MFKQLKLLLAVVVVVALAAAPAAGARPHHPKPPLSAAAAFVLPSSGQCVKGNTLKVTLRKISHLAWTSVVVKLDGRRLTTISPSQAGQPVSLDGLPSGAYTLSITAKTNDHRSVTAERRYHACATEPPINPPPPPPPPPFTDTNTDTDTNNNTTTTGGGGQTPTSPQAGAYRSSGYWLFFVSPDGSHVQDVMKSTSLSCSTGGGINYEFSVTDLPIATDDSFGSTEVESAVIHGVPVKVTTTFSGDFNGTQATGSYRQDVAYEDDSGKTCTTNTQSWSASPETGQGSQVVAPPQAGAYRSSGYWLFFVSPDHSHVQDVMKRTSLSCNTGGALESTISITDIPVEGQSTFATTQVENSMVSGKPVKVITTFKGHFHGLDGNGHERVAGTYREDIVFEDGSNEKCTSDTQWWTAEVEGGQGSQVLASPQPGAYRSSGYWLFFVSPDRSHLQDVIKNTSLICSTGATRSSSFTIEDIPIEGQSTFKTSQIENTIISNEPVKITTVFQGHFHGLEGNGTQRAAGTYREEIVFEGDSNEKCTTGTQWWTAEVEGGQGSQALGPPQVGFYRSSGYEMFGVSADHAHIQNVVKNTNLVCSTGGNINSSFAIADIPIEGQSTFRKTQVETGLYSGVPVKFSVTFNGHFHGYEGNGTQRAAGTYREDIVFEDGSGKECTTGTVWWSAGWYSS
jgi:hypothetical protein